MILQARHLIDPVTTRFRKKIIGDPRLEIYHETNNLPDHSIFEEIEEGLTSRPKYLTPKYFYDDRGSKLFEQITKTTEYYPTKTEKSILLNSINELCALNQNIDVIVELGSGNSEKTSLILEEFLSHRQQLHYIPIDISNVVIESSKNLYTRFPNLRVAGIISEYERGLFLVPQISKHPKLIIFLGSSIGNFEYSEMIEFLSMIRELLNEDDRLLIGFDMKKDRKVLHAAYNDPKGITRAFNLNILRRINRELQAEFDLTKFRHYAFFNEIHSRIEMHLVSKEAQEVHIHGLDLTVRFRAGETIHTENSYKFNDQMIENLASKSNLKILNIWTDKKKYFNLTLFQLA